LVEEGAKDRVGEVIRRAGAEVLDVKVAPHGVKVKVRKAKAGK
jgi:hypothetical protein